MPDFTAFRIETASRRTVVSLKVARGAADAARQRLGLAAPLCASGDEPRSLWLGPDHWLLTGSPETAERIVELCRSRLAGLLHNAVDLSAGYAVLCVKGDGARDLLACGSGLDFRARSFSRGACRSTRFAQIACTVAAVEADEFELYVDRAYAKYLREWLDDSMTIARRAAGDRKTSRT